MDNELSSSPLRNASVALNSEKRRFKVNLATLTPRDRNRVRLMLSGPNGSVEINMPRQEFWRLTSRFHEASAAVHFGEKPRRKRS